MCIENLIVMEEQCLQKLFNNDFFWSYYLILIKQKLRMCRLEIVNLLSILVGNFITEYL